MASKKELSSEINSMLDTDLDWSQMKKDDLEQLKMMIEEGLIIEPLVKKVASDKSKEKLDEMVNGWSPGQLLTGGL